MSRTIYFVSASHVSPNYTFHDTLVQVAECSDGFYASHAKLGCGKTFPTADSAIYHLFGDHACRVTAFRAAGDQFNAAYCYRNGGTPVELEWFEPELNGED